MPQAVFQKAVKKYLPTAIPVSLERIDEYSVGKVLVYSKKPRKLIPMRKHELDFTGFSLQSLLSEDQNLNISSERSFLFDTDKSTITKSVKVDLSADIDLDNAITKLLSAKVDFNVKGGENKNLTISTDFGKITHISTDLVTSIVKGTLRANPDHAIVKKAVSHGGVMFVVTDIYEAEKCSISVSLSEDITEGAGVDVEATKAGTKDSEGVDDKHTSTSVVTRDQPTPLAYLLMKVTVDSKGKISTQLNTQLSSKLHVYFPNPIPIETPKAASSDAVVPKKVGALGSAPKTGPQDIPKDAPDMGPDDHYIYSLKDFQPFESMTYQGILGESKQWVAAFVTNTKLRDAFFEYIKPPKTYERLNDLSAYFLDVGNAMRAGETPPSNTLKDIDPILAALSTEQNRDKRLAEITSVIVVAEAADEFPQHIVQQIVDLPKDKRQPLMKIILESPYGSSRHTYSDEGPFKDPALTAIMRRMGFSIPANSHNLVHTRKDSDDEEDSLAAALILLLASEK